MSRQHLVIVFISLFKLRFDCFIENVNLMYITECGKMFGRQVMLMRHIRVHTSMKPYKCIQCDYRSYKGGNIVLHARKVHGRQGTMKDVITLQEEKAAMDAMVETVLKKGDPNNPIFQQMQRAAAAANVGNSSVERLLENDDEIF